MESVLVIAGSDSGAGAGIQADLKTCMARGVYATTALTALTAQNTQGVQGIFTVPQEFIAKQIDSVMEDIGSTVWKTGMLADKQVITTVADKVKRYQIKKLVVDPVMVSQSGDSLFETDARDQLIKQLIPLAYVITPNIPEAQVLTGLKISTVNGMKKAAQVIYEMGAIHIVIKGGHLDSTTAVDVLFDGKKFKEFVSPMIQTNNNHGTGCTFASCIAAEIAKGKNVTKAVTEAKKYITNAIKNAVDQNIGKGNGPVNHYE